MLPIQTISLLLAHNEQPIIQALPQQSLKPVLPSVSSDDETLEIGAEGYEGQRLHQLSTSHSYGSVNLRAVADSVQMKQTYTGIHNFE